MGMWKDKFAPETHRSAVSNSGQAAVIDRRIEPEKNRGTTAVSFGGFMTAVPTAESDREIKSIRYETMVSFGGQATDHDRRSPIEVKTKEKPRAFSVGGLRAKPSTH